MTLPLFVYLLFSGISMRTSAVSLPRENDYFTLPLTFIFLPFAGSVLAVTTEISPDSSRTTKYFPIICLKY